LVGDRLGDVEQQRIVYETFALASASSGQSGLLSKPLGARRVTARVAAERITHGETLGAQPKESAAQELDAQSALLQS